MTRRRNHYDVTNRVEIARPAAVCAAVCELLQARYPAIDLAPVERAFGLFAALYSGTLRGFHGCDTWYHDAQHSLDCALAFARLLGGHEEHSAAQDRLGARRAVLGVIAALFHDAGYIRKHEDTADNGAAFTLTHVGRSARFLGEHLPTLGFGPEAVMATQLVHFTGYELALDAIAVDDPKDRLLGFLLGTADVLAQTADRCYLEKCRDYLFREFRYCGLAGTPQPGQPVPVYASPEQLLRQTPAFNDKMWADRINGYFGGVHRYMRAHFDGTDLYQQSIDRHMQEIRGAIADDALDRLTLKPRAIRAAELQAMG